MRVRVLGSLALQSDDGSTIDVSGDRQRRLLALLAQRLGQTVPAEVLADAIWEWGTAERVLSGLWCRIVGNQPHGDLQLADAERLCP